MGKKPRLVGTILVVVVVSWTINVDISVVVARTGMRAVVVVNSTSVVEKISGAALFVTVEMIYES